MTEILTTISIVSYILAGVAFALAVVFWFWFRIPKVISELSGRTAKASIAKMRADNERTGAKIYAPSHVNLERGMLTQNVGEIKQTGVNPAAGLTVNTREAATDIASENKSDFVGSSLETELLDCDTQLLSDVESQTQLAAKRVRNINIVDEIVYVHTDEVIE